MRKMKVRIGRSLAARWMSAAECFGLDNKAEIVRKALRRAARIGILHAVAEDKKSEDATKKNETHGAVAECKKTKSATEPSESYEIALSDDIPKVVAVDVREALDVYLAAHEPMPTKNARLLAMDLKLAQIESRREEIAAVSPAEAAAILKEAEAI